MPANEMEVVNNVLCRDISQPDADDVPADPTIAVIDQLVGGIVNGTDLRDIKDEVGRILASQREKLEVIMAVMRNHDYWRVGEWLKVRAENELRLFRASKRGDLTTAEALAFMRVANAEIERFLSKAQADATQVDSSALMEKVDSTSAKREKSVAQAYNQTTPHGREIIRKRLYQFKRSLAK